MEIKCPLTGDSCISQKHFTVTDIVGKDVHSNKFCDQCIERFLGKKLSDIVLDLPDNLNKKRPEEVPLPPALAGLIEFFDSLAKDIEKVEKSSAPCPECGITIQEILNTKKVGCGNCYTHFNSELDGIIKIVQNTSEIKHVGKKPKNRSKKSIQELKKELKIAVFEENYEEASKIRDELKQIKKPPSNESKGA